MGSQRTYATIKERIAYTFMNNSITPDKSYRFFKSLYPLGMDISVAIEVIIGMANFIREEIPIKEIEYSWSYDWYKDVGLVGASIKDNLFELDYALTLGNFDVKIYNYRYTHTTTIDIVKDRKTTTINNKNYQEYRFYIDRCADTLATILSAVYNRRWSNG